MAAAHIAASTKEILPDKAQPAISRIPPQTAAHCSVSDTKSDGTETPNIQQHAIATSGLCFSHMASPPLPKTKKPLPLQWRKRCFLSASNMLQI
jgi:hypothetical protein